MAKILVDAEGLGYGTIDDNGTIVHVEERGPLTYDLVDEIASRVIEHGGEVLAVRGDEQVGAHLKPVAAILRWA